MGFFIPAEVANSTSAFGSLPPGTGYYPVTITQVEDRCTTDSKGNYSFFIHIQFPDGASTKSIGSIPFDSQGNPTQALMALSEGERKKKIDGLVGRLKSVFISAGLEEYIKENGMDTDHLVNRTAYVEWLGRPEDTPPGVKAYGDIKNWMTPEAFAALPEGAEPSDTRVFPWRSGAAAQSSARPAQPAQAAAAPARPAAPPPRPTAARLPPPPAQ